MSREALIASIYCSCFFYRLAREEKFRCIIQNDSYGWQDFVVVVCWGLIKIGNVKNEFFFIMVSVLNIITCTPDGQNI